MTDKNDKRAKLNVHCKRLLNSIVNLCCLQTLPKTLQHK